MKRALLAAAAAVFLLLVPVVPAQAGSAYRPIASQTLAPGVRHEVWAVAGSTARVNVGRLAPQTAGRLQLVQAHNQLAAGLETPSSMCRRTPGCLMAVNGDYFRGGQPFGGLVIGDRLVRSPVTDHEQLSLDPMRANVRGLGWGGAIYPRTGHPVPLNGVNVEIHGNQVILYTPAYAATTPPCRCYELILHAPVDAPPGDLGQPTTATIVGHRAGRTPLPRGTAVLAGTGNGAAELRGLLAIARANPPNRALTLSVSLSDQTSLNIGAHPILLHHGRPTGYDRSDPTLATPLPHTVVGWNEQGVVWLITVDGRQPHGPGLNANQIVDLLRRLGATEAVSEDGGGSTAFVVRGHVVNRPSDGKERPVANAILITVPTAAPPPQRQTHHAVPGPQPTRSPSPVSRFVHKLLPLPGETPARSTAATAAAAPRPTTAPTIAGQAVDARVMTLADRLPLPDSARDGSHTTPAPRAVAGTLLGLLAGCWLWLLVRRREASR